MVGGVAGSSRATQEEGGAAGALVGYGGQGHLAEGRQGLADCGQVMACSFRASWGPGGMLVVPGVCACVCVCELMCGCGCKCECGGCMRVVVCVCMGMPLVVCRCVRM